MRITTAAGGVPTLFLSDRGMPAEKSGSYRTVLHDGRGGSAREGCPRIAPGCMRDVVDDIVAFWAFRGSRGVDTGWEELCRYRRIRLLPGRRGNRQPKFFGLHDDKGAAAASGTEVLQELLGRLSSADYSQPTVRRIWLKPPARSHLATKPSDTPACQESWPQQELHSRSSPAIGKATKQLKK